MQIDDELDFDGIEEIDTTPRWIATVTLPDGRLVEATCYSPTLEDGYRFNWYFGGDEFTKAETARYFAHIAEHARWRPNE